MPSDFAPKSIPQVVKHWSRMCIISRICNVDYLINFIKAMLIFNTSGINWDNCILYTSYSVHKGRKPKPSHFPFKYDDGISTMRNCNELRLSLEQSKSARVICYCNLLTAKKACNNNYFFTFCKWDTFWSFLKLNEKFLKQPLPTVCSLKELHYPTMAWQVS